MVEAWRLNKHKLCAVIPEAQQLHLFLIFTDTRMPDYAAVSVAVIKGIDKLLETCKHSEDKGNIAQ